MAERNTDILQRIIQNDIGRMGSTFRPKPVEEDVADMRSYLGAPQPVVRDDFGGPRVPQTPSAPAIEPDFTPPRDPMKDFSPVYTDDQAYNPVGNPRANPMRKLFGNEAIDAIPSRDAAAPPSPPGEAQAGIPVPDDISAPAQYAGEGVLPQNSGVMFDRNAFAGAPMGGGAPPPPAAPVDIARQGLEAAGRGESVPVDPMAPEQFNPETGERNEEARKLGLLERMFGEKGSDEYKNAGKALMMAGAAIMSTNGDLGTAIGNGIKAGLMTYDDAMTALAEEEKEAREMGMTEEAHALNMQLKRLQLARAGRSGSLSSVTAEPELTPTQQGLVLADQLMNDFQLPPEEALRWGAQQAFGLPTGAGRVPDRDMFSLGE